MDITEVPTAALNTALQRAISGERQEWSPVVMLDELERRGAFGDDHGTIAGYRHHEDRGEEPCDECRAAFQARENRRIARLRRERERRSPDRRAREASIAELHVHWLDVLDCERRGTRHRCPTCP